MIDEEGRPIAFKCAGDFAVRAVASAVDSPEGVAQMVRIGQGRSLSIGDGNALRGNRERLDQARGRAR